MQEMQHEFNIKETQYLAYYSILKAIPKDWICKLKQCGCNDVNQGEEKILLDILMNSKKTPSAYVYPIIVANNYKGCTSDQARMAWELELKIEITKENWYAIRNNCYYLIKVAKLKEFQFRLLSRRITTNVTRNRYDKSIDKNCTFCTKYKETVVHLLHDCEYVRKIWNNIKRWLQYICNVKFEYNEVDIIMNNVKGENDYLIVGP